LSTVAVLVQGG